MTQELTCFESGMILLSGNFFQTLPAISRSNAADHKICEETSASCHQTRVLHS